MPMRRRGRRKPSQFPSRTMNIHEYQAKSLLQKFGVAVPKGGVAYTPQEAEKIAGTLAGPVYVVKAQIHAGGRGAGHFKDNPDGQGRRAARQVAAEAGREAAAMLGHVLVTKQTGPKGREVKRVYIEEGCDIKRELYLGMLIDRATGARHHDGLDRRRHGDRGSRGQDIPRRSCASRSTRPPGWQPFHARKLAFGLGLDGQADRRPRPSSCWRCTGRFSALDASIVEINPLVVTGAGEVIALDAKINFDDNALFRHPDIEAMRDEAEEDPTELEAGQARASTTSSSTAISAAWSTAPASPWRPWTSSSSMAASPANFLDVGGGATKERVTIAFKLILSDPHVEGILVNIFGGIMRCDVIAEGIIAAAREVGAACAAGRAARRHQRRSSARRSWPNRGLPILAPTISPTRREKVVKPR